MTASVTGSSRKNALSSLTMATRKQVPRSVSKAIVVDTNIIIRYLTGDDIAKAERFRSYLRKNRNLYVSDTVMAEIYYVLTTYYAFSRQKALSWLTELIRHPSVQCNESLLQEAIEIVSEYHVSFVDAYTAALARTLTEGRLLSYDRDLSKISGVKRIEP